MTSPRTIALSSDALNRGDYVVVQGNEYLHYNGYVEDTMPAQDIVWIRERRTGERKMFFANECRIFRRKAI